MFTYTGHSELPDLSKQAVAIIDISTTLTHQAYIIISIIYTDDIFLDFKLFILAKNSRSVSH